MAGKYITATTQRNLLFSLRHIDNDFTKKKNQQQSTMHVAIHVQRHRAKHVSLVHEVFSLDFIESYLYT